MQRYPGLGTFAFIDIDNFKGINDELGHATGDHVLVHLSEVLRANTRSVDIVGRYGGEEFILFLPETPEAKALFVIDRMQQHFGMAADLAKGRALTFSAGVAEAPRDGGDFETLCREADVAMYAAKRRGKARVLAWRPDMESRG